MIVVPGEGPSSAKWAIVGEAPGQEEASRKRPFVGKTGQAQDRHLERGGLDRRDGYITNLKKSYHEGNPAPTPEDVAHWGPILLDELRRIKPRYVITAGAHSTRFFLGESAYLEAVHGIPHRFSVPGLDCTIIPTYHPAAPFHQPDLLPFVVHDYNHACAIIRGRLSLDSPVDLHVRPRYYDLEDGVTDWYLGAMDEMVAVDTEGVPGAEWSAQVCVAPGTALVLRRDHPEFPRAAKLLRKLIRKRRPVLGVHAALYDLEMCLGLDLDFITNLDIPIFDTMMAAYLQCLEPQSLKMLAKRHCGMVMQEYMEVVGQAGLDKQLAYLDRVMEGSWPKPEPRVEEDNAGITTMYTPQPVERRAEAILIDYYTEKLDKEGNRTDPLKRWRKVDRDLRRMVERKLGPMPIGTLADVPLNEAVYYAGRDPDATFRLVPKMQVALEEQGLTKLMAMKMQMLRAAVSMKVTGVLGRKASFEKLAAEMHDQMGVIRDGISRKFFSGRPFNPMSSDQTATLMRKRGLVGEKKTKTGKMSTSKKSIEHLRFEDDAIEQIEQWRERHKVKTSFADPVLENWPDEGAETFRVKCDLKITRVSSGRFSAALLDDVPSAPLLAIPVRNDLGKAVRDCYIAEKGYVLGSFDLDQAEMRLMADESGDESLIKIFCDGKIDVHTDTASRTFHIPYETLENDKVQRKKLRDPAKRTNFGIITGIQGSGLYDQLRMAGATGWDVHKCDNLINDVLKLRPGIPKYMEWCREECKRNGGVIRDRWGMPRHLPAILDDTREGKWDRLEAERQTHSHRIQGGAQGYLQNVMGYLWEQFKPYGDAVRWLLQIHDALLLEVHESLQEEVGIIVKDAMANHGGTKLKVPMKSSEAWALSWGQCG